MGTLYEITGDYLRLLEILEEDEDIDPQAFADTLEGIEGEFEIKAENYAKILRTLDAKAKAYKAEIEYMTTRMNSVINNHERLKQRLYDSMKSTGKLKFKTDLFSFGIQKNGGKQPIEVDEAKVTKTYMKLVPDNAKIRQALEGGKKLRFATLKERGDHLVIR